MGDFMKKLFLVLLFLFIFVPRGSAIIGEDYYTENKESIEAISCAENVLPNTLRLVLEVGQSETLYATLLPEDTNDSIIAWSVSGDGDSLRLYPEGSSCRVYGEAIGEGKIEIETLGGAKREVSVSVTEKEEIKTRDFEVRERENRGSVFTEQVVQNIIRTLISFAILLISVALIFFFRRGGRAE